MKYYATFGAQAQFCTVSFYAADDATARFLWQQMMQQTTNAGAEVWTLRGEYHPHGALWPSGAPTPNISLIKAARLDFATETPANIPLIIPGQVGCLYPNSVQVNRGAGVVDAIDAACEYSLCDRAGHVALALLRGKAVTLPIPGGTVNR